MQNLTYKVINNESGKETHFNTAKEAIEYQESLIFHCGIDAEVETVKN